MKYRTRPVEVEAVQWFQPGDHDLVSLYVLPGYGAQTEFCHACGGDMKQHGWMVTARESSRVCPGDWMVTPADGVPWPCKQDLFAHTFQPLEDLCQK